MSTVISEGQKVFEEAVSTVVPAALVNLVGGRVENMARGKERGDQAQDYSTTQRWQRQVRMKVYAEDSGPFLKLVRLYRLLGGCFHLIQLSTMW